MLNLLEAVREDDACTAVELGKAAPDFLLIDPTTEKEVCLNSFQGQDTLLVFFRGTWCPYCREQIALLTQNYGRLQTARVALLGVVCQSKTSVQRYIQQNAVPFPLLPDTQRQVAKRYGVHYWISLEGFNLAKPALFILDKNHCVTFKHIGRNMGDLPVSRILEKFLAFLG